ncbi:Endonuclease/exonuclease/phosphatase [Fimicolochytrium jonesii]|uniref:Endonuclease/exonuclease/phosphatase n=1 Tax=Fimicolochytrium jonesii TaxID=1396493 RepID=UPI0022FF12A5|nr:Endonuclease/exonuclease/phosphatase [Fimicolochytrium jonesii]KAI8816404.1 Endonuclease/exonuclease/phosphatase [Fimicolochytrium jonesii]
MPTFTISLLLSLLVTALVPPVTSLPQNLILQQTGPIKHLSHIALPLSSQSDHSDDLRPRPQPHPTGCSEAPTTPGDRREDKTVLTIGNFNAEWLFLDGGTGGLRCPGRSCPWKNKAMALDHMNHVAQTIASLGLPDIIHLSEVEGCNALDELIKVLENDHGAGQGTYRGYLVPGRDTALGQQVALITKIDPTDHLTRTDDRIIYPVPGSTCGFTKPGTPSRLQGNSKNYIARFVVNGVGITLGGTHLIAYPDKRDRCEKREAQAQVLSQAIQAQLSSFPSDEVIIMGDFNDYDDQIIDAAGVIDTPISQALNHLRTTTSPPLFNLAHTWHNQSERYTNWYDRNGDCVDGGGDEHVLIDHVLVSAGLRGRLMESRPVHKYKNFCGTVDSDHWPIYAKFDFAPGS